MNITYFLLVFIILIIVYFVNKRPSQKPSDIEVYNQALKAIIDNNHKKAFKILKGMIAKDSNNTEAYLLLGNLLRDRDIDKATKIHQTIIVRPKLSRELKVQIHQALGLDYLEIGNTIRAEDEFKKMLNLDSKNKWSLGMLKNIATDNKSWNDALDYEKKLIKYYPEIKKRDESKLNYFVAMDYKDKDNEKNYLYYLKKSIKSDHVYSESYLELSSHHIDNTELAMEYLIMFSKANPSASVTAFKSIENLLFDEKRFDDVENLYTKILDDGFSSYAFNRLVDIYLEKNEKEEAIELVEKFMPKFDYHSKSSNKSYVIRLNRMKIDSDSFETRKALSSFCNDIIENANIN